VVKSLVREPDKGCNGVDRVGERRKALRDGSRNAVRGRQAYMNPNADEASLQLVTALRGKG
jgi:hypothetical protein